MSPAPCGEFLSIRDSFRSIIWKQFSIGLCGRARIGGDIHSFALCEVDRMTKSGSGSNGDMPAMHYNLISLTSVSVGSHRYSIVFMLVMRLW